MILRPEPDFLIDPKTISAAAGSNAPGITVANFPAQSLVLSLPRPGGLAYDMIVPVITFTMNAAVTSGLKGYSFLQVLKRITLGNIPNGQGKLSNIVSSSGVGLLQLASQEGINLDRGTLAALYAHNHSNWPSGGVYRIAYPISCAPARLTDGLRPRGYLPTFSYKQDPLLQLDFAGAAEMSGQANPFSSFNVDVFFLRREMDDAAVKEINGTGGFFSWDMLETGSIITPSLTAGQVRLPLNTQGSYWSLLVWMLTGGATSTPADLGTDGETIWQLQVAKKDIRANFKARLLQIFNDFSRSNQAGPALANSDGAAYVQATSANAVAAMTNFGGPLSAGLAIQAPSSFALEWAGDNECDVRDLSSLFPTDGFAQNGLTLELVADRITTPAAGANNSVINYLGRRIFGDLSTFQLL